MKTLHTVTLAPLLVALACSQALSADSAASTNRNDDLHQKLLGAWTVVAHEINGWKMPDRKARAFFEDTQLVFAEDRIRLVEAGEMIAEGTYTIDTSKVPHTLDMQLVKGELDYKKYIGTERKNIFTFTNDLLMICWTLFDAQRERPTRFSTAPDSGLLLNTYRRLDPQVAACRKQLEQIYAAIQDYRKEHKELPSYFADLVPKHVPDKSLFLCPKGSREKVQPLLSDYAESSLPSHYIYEFSARQLPAQLDPGRMTMRDWKSLQMARLGGIVPIIRCLEHGRALNVSFDGTFFESPFPWERDYTDKVKIEETQPIGARLFLADTLAKFDAGVLPLDKLFSTAFTVQERLGHLPSRSGTNIPRSLVMMSVGGARQAAEFQETFPNSELLPEARMVERFFRLVGSWAGDPESRDRLNRLVTAPAVAYSPEEQCDVRITALRANDPDLKGPSLIQDARDLVKHFPGQAASYRFMLEVALSAKNDTGPALAEELMQMERAPQDVKREARTLIATPPAKTVKATSAGR